MEKMDQISGGWWSNSRGHRKALGVIFAPRPSDPKRTLRVMLHTRKWTSPPILLFYMVFQGPGHFPCESVKVFRIQSLINTHGHACSLAAYQRSSRRHPPIRQGPGRRVPELLQITADHSESTTTTSHGEAFATRPGRHATRPA